MKEESSFLIQKVSMSNWHYNKLCLKWSGWRWKQICLWARNVGYKISEKWKKIQKSFL